LVWKQDLPRKQLLLEYSQARIFVLLSKLESFSRVVHEALVIGVPTVFYNAGATYIQEGLAEAVNSLEPVEIANSIFKVLHKEEKKGVKPLLQGWRKYLESLVSAYLPLIRSESKG